MVAVLEAFLDTIGSTDNPGASTNVNALNPNLRWKTNDNTTIDLIDPVPRPSTGINFSYWKSVYLQCITAPDNAVNNVQFYSDGTVYDTPNVVLYIGNETPTRTALLTTGYDVATGVVGISGDEMVAGHVDITGKTLVSDFIVSATKAISITEAGNIINATGETTDYMIFQLNVIQTATAGNTGTESFTIQYDET